MSVTESIYSKNNIIDPNDVRVLFINIDSRFRTLAIGESTTNFNMVFNTPYKNIIKVRVASVEIPNMWYNFSTSLKNVSFRMKKKSASSYTTISIKDGIYTSEDMIACVSASMKIGLGISAAIEFDMSSLKTILSYNEPFDIDFSNGSTFYSRLGQHLGFKNLKYASVQTVGDDSGLYSVTSEGSVDVIGNAYLLLSVGGFVAVEHPVSATSVIKCLAKIVVREDKGSVIYDDGSSLITNAVVLQKPTEYKSFAIKLMNGYGDILNLNGLNLSFTLELTELMNTTKSIRL